MLRTLLLIMLTTGYALYGACTATKQNSDYSEVASAQTVTLTTGGGHTAAVNSIGDLVVFFGWCFQNCTPGTLTMGTQTATRTSVSTPGTTMGIDGLFTGQAFIYYILAASATGNQTITFNVSGGATQTQVGYIDFSLSTGCTASHHVDSSVGNATGGGTANAPSITGVTGDILFNAVTTTQHVNASVNAPWSCPTYAGAGETQTCQFNTTINGQAYILSAASGSTSANWTLINSSTGWESIISSFSMTQLSANQCPAGVPSGITTCFFVASNGLDTNSGAYESAPWKFAPGMHNCASNCASNTPSSGRGYIFRGGDTWHYGNSGASPYVGVTPSGNGSNCDAGNSCGWSIGGPSSAWTGTVANPIYFGVDQTWFSGGAWVRPVMTGDNALSSVGVGSCSFSDNTFSFLQSWTGSANFIIDNFEFTGLCWSGANVSSVYVSIKNHFGGATTNRVVENNYFHGWSHVTFSCSAGPSGNCENAFAAIDGPSDATTGIGDRISHNVFDGTDTDQQSYSGILFGAYIVEYNVFSHMAQGAILNNNHSFHDNLMDTIYGFSDGQAHGNGIEMNTEFAAVNVFYNNVFKNFFPGGAGCGNVLVWRAPQTTDYAFNNLIYGEAPSCSNGNFWDLITSNQGGADGWTDNEFNNTWVLTANGPFTNSTMNGTATVNSTNLHCISPNGGANLSSCMTINGTLNYTTGVMQTTATAASQGYTSAETFAYSPTSGGNATVGSGTNRQSYCTTLSGSSDAVLQAAGTACQSATGYACTYNTSNHTVSCPALALVSRPGSAAWDIGTYQFNGTSAPTVTTTAVTSFGIHNAVLGGNITSNGGGPITSYGVCYWVSPNPAVLEKNCQTISSDFLGPFTINVTGLDSGTNLYEQAFATNAAGTAYGGNIVFTVGLGSFVF